MPSWHDDHGMPVHAGVTAAPAGFATELFPGGRRLRAARRIELLSTTVVSGCNFLLTRSESLSLQFLGPDCSHN
eukprot:648630-Hanusia_phi.AAC.1